MLSAAGVDGGVLDRGSLAPLSGLLSSLEEQAVQAQVQAANAQAAAAAANNNLAAVLSALGGLPAMQTGGVCVGNPIQQQHQALLVGTPPGSSASQFAMGYRVSL